MSWEDIASDALSLPDDGDACWVCLHNTLQADAVVPLCDVAKIEWRIWAILCEHEAICDGLLFNMPDEGSTRTWAHVSAMAPQRVALYREDRIASRPWLITRDLKVRAVLYCRRQPPLCHIPYEAPREECRRNECDSGVCTESSLRLLDGAGLHAQPSFAAPLDDTCKSVDDVHKLCAYKLKIPRTTQRLYALGPSQVERLSVHGKLPIPTRPIILSAAAAAEAAPDLIVLFKEFRDGALRWLGVAHVGDGQCINDLQAWVAQRARIEEGDTITWAYKERASLGCEPMDLSRPLHSFCTQGECIVVYRENQKLTGHVHFPMVFLSYTSDTEPQ